MCINVADPQKCEKSRMIYKTANWALKNVKVGILYEKKTKNKRNNSLNLDLQNGDVKSLEK